MIYLALAFAKDGRCGTINKKEARCPNNYCCSATGYCGISRLHCGSGCQAEFGDCKPQAPITKIDCGFNTTKDICHNCPETNEKLCSDYGYKDVLSPTNSAQVGIALVGIIIGVLLILMLFGCPVYFKLRKTRSSKFIDAPSPTSPDQQSLVKKHSLMILRHVSSKLKLKNSNSTIETL
eukprot:NODE_58_length_25774_cov_0.240545.p8 type:complete len:179 gc:universal NODE_58_length_25774_cov_0.240545:16263-15727(-)